MSDQPPPQPPQPPQYTAPPPQPPGPVNVDTPPSRPRWLLPVAVIVAACVVLGIIGALTAPRTPVTSPPGLGTAGPRPTAPAGTSAPAAEPTPPPVAPTDTAPAASRSQPGIGDTTESEGLRITLNEVRHEETGNLPPDAGYEYIIVNVTFENTSTEPKSFSTLLSMELRDDTGQKYNVSITANTKGSPDGSVAPGDKLRGEVAYQVPKDATGLVWIFDPKFGGAVARFTLDR